MRAGPLGARLCGRIGLAALLVLLATAALLTPTPIARADDPDVRVTLLGITPVAPTSGSTLTLSGRIANGGFTEYTSVGVRLTLSVAPLPSRAAIRQVSEGSPEADGPAVTETYAVADVLRAGTQRRFRVSTPISTLPLGAPGVYVVGVQVVANSPVGFTVLGSSRTLLPWVPMPSPNPSDDPAVESPIDIPDPTRPVGVAWLWPYATWPGRTPEGVLLRDTLPREISPGGRLRTLLDVAASGPPALTWVADPELLESVTDMTDGYLVERRGQVRAGTADDEAASWIEDFRTSVSGAGRPVASTRAVWTLPYADVDASAVQRAGLDRDVVRAVTTGPTVARLALGSDPRGGLYWAPGGRIDPSTLNLLASAGVTTVVLREGGLTPAAGDSADPSVTTSGGVQIDTQFGPIRGVVLDQGLYGALTMPQGNTGQIVQARQRFLAETAFVALEPSDEPVILVAGPGNPRWDASGRYLQAMLRSLRTAPWVRLVPLTSVVDAADTTTTRTLASYQPRFAERELDPGYLDRIVAAHGSMESLRSVVVDAAPLTEPVSAALLRAESSAWRNRSQVGADLITSIQRTLDAELAMIRIVSGGTVTFSGDTGLVPVTVANDLDRTVVIGLELTASPAARLSAETLTGIEIEPGRRASLEVPVRVVGGEPLDVSARLLDGFGESFGEPSAITLQSTAYSRAALWVAVAAALVLVLLVVIDIVRRARTRRERRVPDGGGAA